MPPSGFGPKAIQGLLAFVQGNYEDLQQEVRDGKHPDFETAIDNEISNLERALERLHIDNEGKVVERPQPSSQ